MSDDVHLLIKKIVSREKQLLVWGLGEVYKNIGIKILDLLEIKPDYYYDENINNLDITVIEKDKIFDFEKNKNQDVICMIMIGTARDISPIICKLQECGITGIIRVDQLCELKKIQEEIFPFLKKSLAIYTCITGHYDYIRQPEIVESNCDYYLISDEEPEDCGIYQWINVDDVVPKGIADNILKNRFCKMNPHVLFPDYKYSLYLDGNIQLKSPISFLIDALPSSGIGVSTMHQETFLTHAIKMYLHRMDSQQVLFCQVEKYWMEGMPLDNGVFLCNAILREHNNPICRKVMNDWWGEYKGASRRDQLSFVYALWKNGLTESDVMTMYKLDSDWNNYGYIHNSPYWSCIHDHLGTFTAQIKR